MVTSAGSRNLDTEIAIHESAARQVDELWDRFEVFEALHHDVSICNPMSSSEVDEMLDWVDPQSGDRVLDLGCGNGTSLVELAQRGGFSGTGVDLSPWMLNAATRSHRARAATVDISWVLGDGARYTPRQPPEVALCLGAEWIWHDFNGTARALTELAAPGGKIAIGAMRLHLEADQSSVLANHGAIPAVADQRSRLESLGLQVDRVVHANDAGWDRYIANTGAAVAVWLTANPGLRSEDYANTQREWAELRERDRGIIGWSLWLCRTPG